MVTTISRITPVRKVSISGRNSQLLKDNKRKKPQEQAATQVQFSAIQKEKRPPR